MENFWNAWDGFVMNLALVIVVIAGAALIAIGITALVVVIKRELRVAKLRRDNERRLKPWKYDPVTLKRLPKSRRPKR